MREGSDKSGGPEIVSAEPPTEHQSHNADVLSDPDHWRDAAAVMRLKAKDVSDPETKAAMLRIADEYNELAARAERRRQRQHHSDKKRRDPRLDLGWAAVSQNATCS